MVTSLQVRLIDNAAIKSRPDNYITVTVDVKRIMASWQASLFSYEWLLPDGRIKDPAELPEKEQPKREAVENSLKKDEALERPVLGIGLLENVEIGSGRAVFLTLAAHGVQTLDVHIPKSNKSEFTAFLAK